MRIRRRAPALCSGFAALLLSAVSALPLTSAAAAEKNDVARFLGAITLPDDAALSGTTIGGLSGITYNPGDDTWYFISDDKSEHGPARYYAADVTLDGGRLAGVHFRGMTPLRRPDGKIYAQNGGSAPDDYVDPEAIAYTGRGLIWTSEGSADPFVQNMITSSAMDGTVLRRYDLPAALVMDQAHTRGARDNNGLEALSITPGGGALWLGMEEPVVQDGDLPDETHGADVRLSRLDPDTGALVGQYAYRLEPRRRAALPGKHADGPGLAEMVALNATHALTLERSWVEGVTNYVQIYRIDLAGATDIAGVDSLRGATYRPVGKRLVLDLNAVGIQMDNYEGMALGPTLPDGRRLMLLCVDNNFSRHEKTIIAAFALDLNAVLAP